MFEYYYAFLAVLLLGLICAFIIRHVHRAKDFATADSGANRPGSKSKTSQTQRKVVYESHSAAKRVSAARDDALRLERELHTVRTPWGWPQHSSDKVKSKSQSSRAMNFFTDRLVQQKKNLESKPAESRARESLRALIEDRFVPAKWNSPNEIEYRKVKPPMLRDPRAPHDQMDNFGVKQTEVVRSKLLRVAGMNVDALVASKRDELRYVRLKNVKLPWGW